MCGRICGSIMFFFFFKQKTAYEMRISDWSSDVCSSDLDTRFLSGTGNFIPFNNSRTTLRLLNAASKGHEVPGWQMSVLPIGYSYSPWSAKGRVAAPQFGHKAR